MMRPSRRAVLLFSAGLPVPVMLLVIDSRLWPLSIDYSAFVLLVIVVDMLLAFPGRQLSVSTQLPERLFIGETGALEIVLAATPHRRAVRFEMLCDHLGPLDPTAMVAAIQYPGNQARATITVRPHRRGQISIERLWVRWRGPLGLVETIRTVPLSHDVDVFPNVRAAQEIVLNTFPKDALFGSRPQPQRGDGAEFDALRDFTTGDDRRFIDWKRSARHRKLVCKEFIAERNAHVVLAFDTGHLMGEPLGPISRLDHGINAGLLLGWIALRGGDLVGTFAFDSKVRHYRQPVRGVQAFGHVERASAELTYGYEETNFTLGLAELGSRLKRRALVVLFTDFIDTVTAELMIENMARLANRHVVLFVTLRNPVLSEAIDHRPERFYQIATAVLAFDAMREREIVLERLDRIGVHCLDVEAGQLPISLLNRYLAIKQRNLL